MPIDTNDSLEVLVARLREGAEQLTVTATLDLTPDGSGQPPVLRSLRQAAREAVEGLDGRVAAAVEAEIEDLEEIATDASSRGVLGLVYVAHPDSDPDTPRAEAGDFTVVELAAPVRTSLAAGSGPRIFEIAREGYLERPVALVTVDTNSMHVTRVLYGHGEATTEVEWPERYLAKRGQRTNQDARGGGGHADERGGGHSYVKQERQVQEHRNLFANEAAHHLAEILRDEDILVVEGVEDARQQLLARLPAAVAARALQHPAPDPTEAERDRFARLRAIGEQEQFAEAARRAEEWFSGASPNTVGGVEAIHRAADEGRVASVIVHQDAAHHFGYASDTRLRLSPVDVDAVEAALAAAMGQGAVVYFTDDARVLDEQGGIIGIARY